MQLKSSASKAAPLAGALALAVSGALGSLGAARPVRAGGWSVEQSTLIYREAQRVNVVEPVIQLSRLLPGDKRFGLRYTYDSMSGASPNGVAAADRAQTYTSPSGNAYGAAAGEFPQREFRDWRQALALDWEQPIAERTVALLGASASLETDYLSLGASATVKRETASRLGTWSAGLSLSSERVSPEGGFKKPFSAYGTASDDEIAASDSKIIVDGLVGYSQVLNRHWVADLNLGLGRDAGAMTEPYKGLGVVDAAGGHRGAVYESRPDSRLRTTVDLHNRVHLGRDIVHAGLRWYGDDWGVSALTGELSYWFKPESFFGLEGWTLRPQVRWSRQSAADFFRIALVEGRDIDLAGAPLVEHASADFRLDAMTAWTLGLRVEAPLGPASRWNLKVERYLQSGDGSPDEAVGAQRALDLYPELEVWMATVGWSWTF